jgi:hypothetical protein
VEDRGGVCQHSKSYVGLVNFVRTYNLPDSFYTRYFVGSPPPQFRLRLVR